MIIITVTQKYRTPLLSEYHFQTAQINYNRLFTSNVSKTQAYSVRNAVGGKNGRSTHIIEKEQRLQWTLSDLRNSAVCATFVHKENAGRQDDLQDGVQFFKIVKTRQHQQTNAVITILNLRLNPTRILTLTLTLNENEIYFKYLKYLLSSFSFCDYFLPSTYPRRKELKRFYYNLYQADMADIFVRFERCSFNV